MTNDEKAGKYPCFKANKKEFEVQKRQSRYEIVLESIRIVCGMECYDSHFKMFLNCKKDIVEKRVPFYDSLTINELVKINTSAKEELKDISAREGFYPYNLIFTQLNENLEKYV